MMALIAAATAALAGEDGLRDWQEGRSNEAAKKRQAAHAVWKSPEDFAALARAWAEMGRERMLLKLVDDGLLRTAHLLDDDPVRRAILRAAAENMAARPERELELWRKLVASYWQPGDPAARVAREALASVLDRQFIVKEEAIALRRAIYADHRDSVAASGLVITLLGEPWGHEEAEAIASEWFARSEPGPARELWALLLGNARPRLLELTEKDGELGRGHGDGGIIVPGPEHFSPSHHVESLRPQLAKTQRAAFYGLTRAAGVLGSLNAALAQSIAWELADDVVDAFSRAYLSVHPREATNVAALLADQLAMLGLAGPAAEIARRAEALLIEHQGEDSPILEMARSRLAPFVRPTSAAPNPAQ